jgi:hypothetical protein
MGDPCTTLARGAACVTIDQRRRSGQPSGDQERDLQVMAARLTYEHP